MTTIQYELSNRPFFHPFATATALLPCGSWCCDATFPQYDEYLCCNSDVISLSYHTSRHVAPPAPLCSALNRRRLADKGRCRRGRSSGTARGCPATLQPFPTGHKGADVRNGPVSRMFLRRRLGGRVFHGGHKCELLVTNRTLFPPLLSGSLSRVQKKPVSACTSCRHSSYLLYMKK